MADVLPSSHAAEEMANVWSSKKAASNACELQSPGTQGFWKSSPQSLVVEVMEEDTVAVIKRLSRLDTKQ